MIKIKHSCSRYCGEIFQYVCTDKLLNGPLTGSIRHCTLKSQELESMDRYPLFIFFFNLCNYYDNVDRGHLMRTLEGYVTGLPMCRFLEVFCKTSSPAKTGTTARTPRQLRGPPKVDSSCPTCLIWLFTMWWGTILQCQEKTNWSHTRDWYLRWVGVWDYYKQTTAWWGNGIRSGCRAHWTFSSAVSAGTDW